VSICAPRDRERSDPGPGILRRDRVHRGTDRNLSGRGRFVKSTAGVMQQPRSSPSRTRRPSRGPRLRGARRVWGISTTAPRAINGTASSINRATAASSAQAARIGKAIRRPRGRQVNSYRDPRLGPRRRRRAGRRCRASNGHTLPQKLPATSSPHSDIGDSQASRASSAQQRAHPTLIRCLTSAGYARPACVCSGVMVCSSSPSPRASRWRRLAALHARTGHTLRP
jgi:hypothetical protein